jgi:replicative DNA helicase
MRQRTLNGSEIARLQIAADAMKSRPIFIDDTPGMSVMEIRAKSRRLKMLHDVQIVFVDYLQLMYDPAGRENRQQEIASISRGLKALGRELNIPIVALAQLNRQVEGRSSNRPRMSDLRESGAIEQDADVVMLLHREEYYLDKNKPDRLEEVRGKAELIIDKQRNGPTGIVTLHFTPKYTRFDNAAAAYIPDVSQPADDDYDPVMSFDADETAQGGTPF